MRYDDINVDMLYIDSHEYINKVNNSIFDKLWCLMNLVSKYYIELFTLGINKCSLAEFMVNVHNGNIYSKKNTISLGSKFYSFVYYKDTKRRSSGKIDTLGKKRL